MNLEMLDLLEKRSVFRCVSHHSYLLSLVYCVLNFQGPAGLPGAPGAPGPQGVMVRMSDMVTCDCETFGIYICICCPRENQDFLESRDLEANKDSQYVSDAD